jgi:hypothetical protein
MHESDSARGAVTDVLILIGRASGP